jgi:hypothetical protein
MKRTAITVILTLAFTAFAIQAVEQKAFSGAGIIESTTGGFMFPDGSVQESAAAPTWCTAITSVPYSIDTAGVYCFTGNLNTSMTSGIVIAIQADNVVLDLNGWKLDGLGAGNATSTLGIWASERKNITIRNGTIRGFLVGISLTDNAPFTASESHLIEGIRADKNTYLGMEVKGRGNMVRDNRVVDTGGSISNTIATGMELAGIGVHVLNNAINSTTATGDEPGTGMWFGDVDGAVIEGNRIDDVRSADDVGRGIVIGSSTGVLTIGNRITNADYGIMYLGSTGKYRDNMTSEVTTSYIGGFDSGNND